MADYRISRFVRTTYRKVTLSGSDQIVAARTNDRVGIEFAYTPVDLPLGTSVANVFIAIDAVAIASQDIELSGVSNRIKWFFGHDGDTSQREFHAVETADDAGHLCIIEHWLPEHILNSYLEKL